MPVVTRHSTLEEVVRAMVHAHRCGVAYVVDKDCKPVGYISLDILKDAVFRWYLDGRVSDALVVTEHIVELFASDKAEDLLEADLVVCGEDESLHSVLSRMIENDVKDVAVIDARGVLVGNLDILDLLELWLREKAVVP